MKTAKLFLLSITLIFILICITQAQSSFAISNKTTGDTLLTIDNEGGSLFTGTYGSGIVPVTGTGTRLMWYPGKAAIRAGYVNGSQWDDAQIGNYSIGLGNGTTASGQYSTALGVNNTANGLAAMALGANSRAYGTASTAMGNNTEASGTSSTALGLGTTASGNYSLAIGQEIEAQGSHTVAIALSDQNGLQIIQDSTLAIMGGKVGIETTSPTAELQVGGTQGVLFTGTITSGTIPVEGEGTRLMWYPGKAAFRVGNISGIASTFWDNDSIGDYSVALGSNSNASGIASTAMGRGTSAIDYASTAMGHNTKARGHASTAMGYHAIASGLYSTAMGNGTSASGITSTAMGLLTIASGQFSTAFGREIEAAGEYSVAIALSDQNGLQITQDSTLAIMGGKVGIDVTDPSAELQVGGTQGVLFTGAFGSGTIPVEGQGTRMMWYPGKAAFRTGRVYSDGSTFWDDDSIGNYSIAAGLNSRATASASTAMGYSTIASNYYSTAMGFYSRASGDASTAMGSYTNAIGLASTSMGYNTIASGEYSTAMGNYSIASNYTSTAMGFYSSASGWSSTAMGLFTSAKGNYSTAIGMHAKANHVGSIVIAANSDISLADSVRSGGNEQMVLRADGGLYITNIAEQAPYDASRLINTVTGGYLSSGGTWTDASSREYKENISNLSLEQAINAVQQLQPVTYNYKADKEENCVGFIAEDVPGLVAVKDRKGLSPMDIVAVLTKVVQNQQSEINWLKQKINQLENK